MQGKRGGTKPPRRTALAPVRLGEKLSAWAVLVTKWKDKTSLKTTFLPRPYDGRKLEPAIIVCTHSICTVFLTEILQS